MRILLQRVSWASVTVDEVVVGRIDRGLLLLVGVGQGDGKPEADALADKVSNLRIFTDEQGKMNLSVLEIQGGALVVSQFTLYADARKGRRPSFTDAGKPEVAAPLVNYFAEQLGALGVKHVATGVFGAHMLVDLRNDGPVTIWLDSADLAVRKA